MYDFLMIALVAVLALVIYQRAPDDHFIRKAIATLVITIAAARDEIVRLIEAAF